MKKKKRFWTVEEDLFLVENYPDGDIQHICKVLNRTYSSVTGRAPLLGVRRSAEKLKEIGCNSAFIEAGKKTLFTKGQESWNAGTKTAWT
ncbi:hypothetical protein [Myroides odoratus]|uniref:hypothetical protein n=1 Tax=Myroides odoratus TaxID=256 RepID=UPI0039AEE887